MAELLSVQGLETHYITNDKTIYAVNDVSFKINEGDIVGLIGECGSGKSTLLLSILRSIPQPTAKIVNGKVIFKGADLLSMEDTELQRIRGKSIGFIPQDYPMALNPTEQIGDQLVRSLMQQERISKADAKERILKRFNQAGIPEAEDCFNNTPALLSSGVLQKVLLVKAMLDDPELLIADQASSAMDPITQLTVIDLLGEDIRKRRMSVLWVTNDLGLTARFVQKVFVLCGGSIVEEASSSTLFSDPCHPYTLGLLGSSWRIARNGSHKLQSIPGYSPLLTNKPTLCPYLDRCGFSIERCKTEKPVFAEVGEDHFAACWVEMYHRRPQK